MILPSLPTVKNAVSAANSWLESSKPFLQSSLLSTSPSNAVLSFEDLKVSNIIYLKVHSEMYM